MMTISYPFSHSSRNSSSSRATCEAKMFASSDLLGVGRATKKVLDGYCINTIGDLARTDPNLLKYKLGKNGVDLWRFANGQDHSLVHKQDFVSPIKSVGHGITTVEDLETSEQVWPVLLELTQDIGHKLRVHQKSAEGVAIFVRDNTLQTKQFVEYTSVCEMPCGAWQGFPEANL